MNETKVRLRALTAVTPDRVDPVAPGARQRRTAVAVYSTHPVIATGVGELLDRDDTLSLVGTASEADDLVSLIVDEDVQVVVLNLFGRSGDDPHSLLDAIRGVANSAGRVPATVCIIPTSGAVIAELIDRGASIVLTTAEGPNGLVRAVVAARTRVRTSAPTRLPKAHTTRRPAQRAAHSLTRREVQVLEGMVDGLSSRDIAEDLGLTVNTVRTHVQRLLPKLGVHTRLRATAVALERGIVSRPGPRSRAVSA